MTQPTGHQAGAGAGDSADGAPVRFEEALAEVEAIIQRIESGEVGLEESLGEYERGVRLLRQCRGVLARAEQKVLDLTEQLREGEGRSSGENAGSAGR